MLITLYHSLVNPHVHADLSGLVTSFMSPSADLYKLERAIATLQLYILWGMPDEGIRAVNRILS